MIGVNDWPLSGELRRVRDPRRGVARSVGCARGHRDRSGVTPTQRLPVLDETLHLLAQVRELANLLLQMLEQRADLRLQRVQLLSRPCQAQPALQRRIPL